MNKFVPLMLAAVVACATATYAGDSCCKSAKTDDAKAAGASCSSMFSKLNLTADQQAKLTALKAECNKEGCSEATRAKMMKGLESILTPEQLAQCKAAQGTAGCPTKNGTKN